MKSCLSNTAGLKECDHFLFPSLPSIRSTVCDLYGHSTLCPSVSPNFFPTVGEGLPVWLQFLIHIGSGRWILPSCSPSLFHLEATLLFQVTRSPHGYSKWMNMPWARAQCIYFQKYHPHIIIPLLPPHMSGESFIITKTAHSNDAGVHQLHVCKQIRHGAYH